MITDFHGFFRFHTWEFDFDDTNLTFFVDMALIRFVILDDDFIGDEFIGQYTIAYSCLLPGYRVLKLHGIFGEELEGASLLVHIQYSSSRESTKKRTMLRRRPSRSLSQSGYVIVS